MRDLGLVGVPALPQVGCTISSDLLHWAMGASSYSLVNEHRNIGYQILAIFY